MKVNMFEAKTNLSKLVNLLDKEEEIIIAKSGKPVAKLVPYKKKERKIGLLKDKGYFVAEDFDDYDAEIAELFGMEDK